MKTYKVYFEFYGKKMKTTITASTEVEAKGLIKDKIKFIKVERENNLDSFKNIFGI